MPCSKRHALEVYATFEVADGPYPGQGDVIRLAEGGCGKRFTSFVGVGYDDSNLDMYYYYPLAGSWSVDRRVTCTVGASTPSTGTLKGSER